MQPEVKPFRHENTGTWSYVVWDPDNRRAAVIDPVLDYDHAAGRSGTASADEIVAFVRDNGLTVDWLLETHAHADHLSAAPHVRAALGGTLAIGEGIRVVQQRFKRIFNLEPGFAADGSQFDKLFADDERFALGSIEGRVIPTPGHTSDSVTYLIGDAGFVGDSLFMPDAGTARCDFPGGDPSVLYESSRRLFELADDTRLFMCHDYQPGGREALCETTVGEQRRSNIHVAEGIPEPDFVRMRTDRDRTLALPQLILPSVQVNIRGGEMPPAEDNGVRYLKIPVNQL